MYDCYKHNSFQGTNKMAQQRMKLGDYDIDFSKPLGRGSFGTVYQARDVEGQPVAAKRICFASDQEACRKEFISFCNMPHDIPTGHPNVIKMFHADRHEQTKDTWLFMEYCNFGNLDKFFQGHPDKLQSIEQKVQAMTQIAQGLDFLHGKSVDIVHRDIKPGNILVTSGSSVDQVYYKLADFGLAKWVTPEMGSTMSTNVGTKFFKAPEFWKPNKEGNLEYHRSIDVFSLGLTFMSLIQAVPGKNLQAIVEGTLDDTTEKGEPIGRIMTVREAANQPELTLLLDKYDEDDTTKVVKMVIKQMLQVQPSNRLSAGDVLLQLYKVFNDSTEQIPQTVILLTGCNYFLFSFSISFSLSVEAGACFHFSRLASWPKEA